MFLSAIQYWNGLLSTPTGLSNALAGGGVNLSGPSLEAFHVVNSFKLDAITTGLAVERQVPCSIAARSLELELARLLCARNPAVDTGMIRDDLAAIGKLVERLPADALEGAVFSNARISPEAAFNRSMEIYLGILFAFQTPHDCSQLALQIRRLLSPPIAFDKPPRSSKIEQCEKPAIGGERRGPPPGCSQKVTDEVLAAALKESGGNRARAAAKVGLARQVISRRVNSAKVGSPLVEFKGIKTKGGPPPRVTDGELAAALKESEGNQNHAAKKVGLARQVVNRRVRAAKIDSPLAEFKAFDKPPRSSKIEQCEKPAIAGKRRGPPPGYGQKVTDEVLAAALRESRGNQARAAAKVGLAGQVISRRVNSAKVGSPLAEFKGIKTKGGPPPRVTDGELAAALRESRGNQARAAAKVGLVRQVISRRVNSAKVGSPLAEFKGIKTKGGPPPRVTDGELAAALKESEGNQNHAAKKVGLARQVVNRRVRAAKHGSPLAEFKTVSRHK